MIKHKNRNSLLIAAAVLVLAVLAVLACGPSSTPMTPTQTPSVPTAAGQAGEVTPTDALAPVPADTPAPTEASVPETPSPTVCVLDAGYVADVTVPDDTAFLPNTLFVKTWRIRNAGSCGWEEGTKLVYVSGDPLGGPTDADIPATAVGSNVDVSVSFTSPGTPGTYRSNWQVQSADGKQFGQQFYVQIVVPEPTATPTNTPPPPTNTPPSTDTPQPTNTPQPTVKPVGDWPLYRSGDSGPAVYAIQYLLNAEGYTLTADGQFGPQTATAVKSFQGAKGLAADGIAGPNTWTALIQGHTVQNGSSGDDVQAVQHLLKHKHGYDITVDGVFGPKTGTAVRDLQKVYGLTVDGIVGPQTWKALVAG